MNPDEFNDIEAEIARHEGTRSPCATAPLPLVVRLRMVLDRYQAEAADLAAARREVEEVKAERDTANDKLTATYCSYCGHREERDDELGSRITQHIRECPKHPMREVEQECLRYDSEATRTRNILTAAGVPYRKPDGSGCVSMPDRVAMLAAGLTQSIHKTDAAVLQVSRLTEAITRLSAMDDPPITQFHDARLVAGFYRGALLALLTPPAATKEKP